MALNRRNITMSIAEQRQALAEQVTSLEALDRKIAFEKAEGGDTTDIEEFTSHIRSMHKIASRMLDESEKRSVK